MKLKMAVVARYGKKEEGGGESADAGGIRT
jgi:hypothetical protein